MKRSKQPNISTTAHKRSHSDRNVASAVAAWPKKPRCIACCNGAERTTGRSSTTIAVTHSAPVAAFRALSEDASRRSPLRIDSRRQPGAMLAGAKKSAPLTAALATLAAALTNQPKNEKRTPSATHSDNHAGKAFPDWSGVSICADACSQPANTGNHCSAYVVAAL